jgi:hypothetical protein
LKNPTTAKIIRYFTDLSDLYELQLINGSTLRTESVEQTALETATLLGNIQGLRQFLSIKDQITEMLQAEQDREETDD